MGEPCIVTRIHRVVIARALPVVIAGLTRNRVPFSGDLLPLRNQIAGQARNDRRPRGATKLSNGTNVNNHNVPNERVQGLVNFCARSRAKILALASKCWAWRGLGQRPKVLPLTLLLTLIFQKGG